MANEERCTRNDFHRGTIQVTYYVGYCGFQHCEILKGIEILYGYSRNHWGKGYAGEAAKAVMAYGLEQLKLPLILAAVNPENVASEKVLQSIGMTYTGKIGWPNQGQVNKYGICREVKE